MPTPIRSVRIPADEWAEIRRAAGETGASEFMRSAALEKARCGQQVIKPERQEGQTAVKGFTCTVCRRLNNGRCSDHPSARQEEV